MHVDSNMSMDEFLQICSKKLKMHAKKVFTTNGEEISDTAYINQDSHIYLTEGEDLDQTIISAYFDLTRKKSMDTAYKINLIILGPPGVGKSSIIIRYVHQQFSDVYIPTVEATFNKVEKVDNETYDLSILDTSGAEEWATLQYEYMSNKDALILAYSIERKENLERVEKIYREIQYNNQEGIPIFLVANKSDLRKREISTAEGQALADKWKIPYFEVSAKSGKNITELFFELTRVAAAGKFEQQRQEDTFEREPIEQSGDPKTGWSSWFFDKCCLV